MFITGLKYSHPVALVGQCDITVGTDRVALIVRASIVEKGWDVFDIHLSQTCVNSYQSVYNV